MPHTRQIASKCKLDDAPQRLMSRNDARLVYLIVGAKDG